MLTDITGKEFKVGQFIASSSSGKATLDMSYIIKVTKSTVRCLQLEGYYGLTQVPERIASYHRSDSSWPSWLAKQFPTEEDWVKSCISQGCGNKKPTSVVIIEPPRLFVLKYMKLLKRYNMPMPCDWVSSDEVVESEDTEIL